MILTNYRNFKNVNYANKVKSIYEENKKNAPKPSYTTKGDYEKVIENIKISCNDTCSGSLSK